MTTKNANEKQYDSVWLGADIASMQNGQYSIIENGAIAVTDGKIAWIGPAKSLPTYQAGVIHNLDGGWITPGLIDCHTHLVFGSNRANEFEQRLNGLSYQEIAKAGGGIMSSVNATRKASIQALVESAQKRLNSLMQDGVTTIEIKSGYGLSLESEIKMLLAAKTLGTTNKVDVITTCLAAHALPPEYKEKGDDYIDYICNEVLPIIAEQNLATSVDAFCEGIGFTPRQVKRYFEAAQALGFSLKLHAEQLSSLGGTSLAANMKALSADHIEYATKEDVKAMANNQTVAVLLPGAFYSLHEVQKPPIELLRENKVIMAIASDANPGTSPVLSLRMMMNMACTLFSLTPQEALAGVTINAAKALGIDAQLGSLEPYKDANFVHWDIQSPAELSYWVGGNLLNLRVYKGQIS